MQLPQWGALLASRLRDRQAELPLVSNIVIRLVTLGLHLGAKNLCAVQYQ